MFDHVTIRVGDRGASQRFYETVLATLGFDLTYSDESFAEWDAFSIKDGEPTRRLHIGFAAPSRAHVDAFSGALGSLGLRRRRRSPGKAPCTPARALSAATATSNAASHGLVLTPRSGSVAA